MSNGAFRNMFEDLEPLVPEDRFLAALSATMIEGRPLLSVDDPREKKLQAGYTYLAQFIDHDITFDQTALFHGAEVSVPVENKRTSRFDLDSVYGGGPEIRLELYQADRTKLRVEDSTPDPGEWDLPRDRGGIAIIGDKRNDSNLVISQLHLAFLNFHNNVVDTMSDGDIGARSRFEAARDIVRRHYQWIVLHEFLPLIAGHDAVSNALRVHGRQPQNEPPSGSGATTRIFDIDQGVYMPFEFSTAAFRFGHSMVRHEYFINSQFGALIFIFDSSKPDDDAALDLRGFRPRPKRMKIDWSRFFHFPSRAALATSVQLARPIDPLIAAPLFRMPTKVADFANKALRPDDILRSVPARNLWRGRKNKLASGQAVAEAMGLPASEMLGHGRPFEIDQRGIQGAIDDIAGTGLNSQDLVERFGRNTPLWYYILKEAQVFFNGEGLGPVGARIVAEVLVGLLVADKDSILNAARDWRPEGGKFGCLEADRFHIADLIDFAGS